MFQVMTRLKVRSSTSQPQLKSIYISMVKRQNAGVSTIFTPVKTIRLAMVKPLGEAKENKDIFDDYLLEMKINFNDIFINIFFISSFIMK